MESASFREMVEKEVKAQLEFKMTEYNKKLAAAEAKAKAEPKSWTKIRREVLYPMIKERFYGGNYKGAPIGAYLKPATCAVVEIMGKNIEELTESELDRAEVIAIDVLKAMFRFNWTPDKSRYKKKESDNEA